MLRVEHGIHEATPGYVIGYFDHVSFAFFRGRVTIDALRVLDDNHMRLAAKHGKVCTLVIATAGLELPDQAAREESARLMRLRADTQLCSCTVLEGDGFFPAAARAVLTTIQLLSRHAYPLHTTRTVTDATRWIAVRGERPLSWASSLAASVERARHTHMPGSAATA